MINKNAIILLGGLLIIGAASTVAIKLSIGDSERDQFDDLFQLWGKFHDVDPLMLKTIASIESDIGQDRRVKAGETSGDGKSWGIMQIAPRIGSQKEIELKGINTTPTELNDPSFSIEKGAKLVSYLKNKYKNDEKKIVMAYNQGERNTDRGRTFAEEYHKRYLRHSKRLTGRIS